MKKDISPVLVTFALILTTTIFSQQIFAYQEKAYNLANDISAEVQVAETEDRFAAISNVDEAKELLEVELSIDTEEATTTITPPMTAVEEVAPPVETTPIAPSGESARLAAQAEAAALAEEAKLRAAIAQADQLAKDLAAAQLAAEQQAAQEAAAAAEAKAAAKAKEKAKAAAAAAAKAKSRSSRAS